MKYFKNLFEESTVENHPETEGEKNMRKYYNTDNAEVVVDDPYKQDFLFSGKTMKESVDDVKDSYVSDVSILADEVAELINKLADEDFTPRQSDTDSTDASPYFDVKGLFVKLMNIRDDILHFLPDQKVEQYDEPEPEDADPSFDPFESTTYDDDQSMDESFDPGDMTAKNGDKITVSPKDAKDLNKFFKTLDGKNKKDFEERVKKSQKAYDEVMKFAKNLNEEHEEPKKENKFSNIKNSLKKDKKS